MPRKATHSLPGRTVPAAESTSVRNPSAWIEHALLLLLLSLIPIRAVLQERFTLSELSWMRRLDAPIGPLPATTLLFNLLIAGCALAIYAVKTRQQRRWVATGTELGLAVLLIAGIVSTSQASNKYTALIGSVDLCGSFLFLIALSQLLTSPWRVRLAICVLLATGTLVVCKCFAQYFIEFPETIRQYREGLAAQMYAGDTVQQGAVYDFERRLEAGTVSGFFAHSNVAATYLATTVLSAIAMAVARWRHSRASRIGAIAPTILALAACLALGLARSKGAVLALAIGMGAWAVGIILYRRLRWRASTIVAGGWWLGGIGAVAIIILGCLRGGLPTLSMLYRWQYWRGSWDMLAGGHAGGIGANNFGTLFTSFKPIECPEDVQDPHSWIVRAAVEWGWLGLAGIVAALIGASLRMTARHTTAEPNGAPAVANTQHHAAVLMPRWLLGTLALLVVSVVVAYSGSPTGDRHAAYVATVAGELAIVWLVAFACLSVDCSDPSRFGDDPLPRMASGIAAALCVFVLHSAIDLAFFYPGAVATLMGWTAVVLSARPPKSQVAADTMGRSPRSAIVAVVASILIGVTTVWMLPSAWTSGRTLLAARAIDGGPTWDTFENSGALAVYERAAAANRWDPVPVDELLGEMLNSPTSRATTPPHCDRAGMWVSELHRRDPLGSACDAHDARLAMTRYEITRDTSHLVAARDAMRRLVDKYPTSPQRRISHAHTLARLAEATRDMVIACEAAAQFRMAVDLDQARIYVSSPNHLPAAERQRLIEAARSLCPQSPSP